MPTLAQPLPERFVVPLARVACTKCLHRISEALADLPGVEDVKLEGDTLHVVADGAALQPEALTTALTHLGHPPAAAYGGALALRFRQLYARPAWCYACWAIATTPH